MEEENMDTQKLCQNCQAPLAADAPRGLCPACLMKVAMATGTVAGEEKAGFTPPGIEELARKFPQLEIIELTGRGGMGAVYKARQKELDRIVALKILPPGIGDDAAFAERFTREARALAKLNHPGIVTIHDFGRADGLYFFVMEFVDGVNLRQLLASGRVSPREALAIVPQICDALQFAHDQGIVHRDIKPENILLDRRGRVKVADFGLAKLVGADALTPSVSHSMGEAGTPVPGAGTPPPALTDAGKVMGTPAYMAPEQASHPSDVDHRADIYALGVVFYQMLTGELPGKQLEAPSKKVHIDVRLDEVVLRALEKTPELRYQQVSDVKTMVETIVTTKPGPVAPQPSAQLNNFSPRAQQALALARQEADRYNHNFVGTEHVLLGLIRLGQGTAVTVLRKLGLMLEGDGLAARVLKNLKVDLGQTRREILSELDPNIAAPINAPTRPQPSTQIMNTNNNTSSWRGIVKFAIVAAVVAFGALAVIFFLNQKPVQNVAKDKSNQAEIFTPPAGPVELKLKWPRGERLVADLDLKQNIAYPLAGLSGTMKQDITLGKQYGMTALQETPDGGHEVELEILSARMGMKMGSDTLLDYDSTKTEPAGPKNGVAAVFGKIVGSKIRYFLDASNSIERVEGVDEMLQRLKSVGQADALTTAVKNMFSEAYFKQLLGFNILIPDHPVQPGDAWASHFEYPVPNTGIEVTDYKVTFKNWEAHGGHNCVRLEFRGVMKVKPDPNSPRDETAFHSQDGVSTGVCWFDPELGRPVETDVKNDNTLVKNPPGQTQPITTQMHQVETIKRE
jgi:serine/threonine protein kinase